MTRSPALWRAVLRRPRPALSRLLCATALALLPLAAPAQTPGCVLIDGTIAPGCETPNAGTVVAIPAGRNTEPDSTAAGAAAGFSISINGTPLVGDRRVEDIARRADVALAEADIQVRFDGLDVEPRLDLERAPGDASPGASLGFTSRMNYPAFVARGEIRIIDLGAAGGPRTLSVVPVAPNGSVTVVLPQGDTLVAVHRVYDAQGRYDETAPLLLSGAGDAAVADGPAEEAGASSLVRRRIPVAGGAVTVSGGNLNPGATVRTLGETLRPAPDGDFVIQRILPTGARSVDVEVAGAGQDMAFTRDIDIPASDWFGVGVADLTLGVRDGDGGSDSYQKGRLSFYTRGKTATGVTVTASADTGEDDLDNLFRDLDEKDPRSLLLRLDPDDYYPVYGDDSTLEEGAPTSGRFYLKVEKDGNHVLWGNFRNAITGAEYIRNERTLYGLQAVWASAAVTDAGEPRLSFRGYVASPDNLPQRDIFRGTGGSVYFLKRQDISIGSETVTVVVRDPDTGRILSRQPLTFGRDYEINYVQGTVLLTRPLSGSAGGGIVSGASDTVTLVVQYEWTPAAGDVDGMNTGGRVEAWVSDQVRLGFSRQVETTATADQTATGVDLRWQASDATWAEIELARSDGPGFSSSFSSDGGLIIDEGAVTGGRGSAFRFETRADLRELGIGVDGFVGAYAERRDAGFSALDYQVSDAERLWGIFGEVQATERVKLAFHYDDYDNAAGKVVREGGADAEFRLSDRLALGFGVLHTDKRTVTETGRRTDVAVRATVTPSDALSWYVFGQTTVARSGLERNDRVGAGLAADLGRGWTAEAEASTGTRGEGGKLRFSQTRDGGDTAYVGWELDPSRELDDALVSGRDGGKLVFGGTRSLSSSVRMFAENSYDLFGRRRTLTSAYGVEYRPDTFLTYSADLEIGRIADPVTGDFDRRALSLGLAYADGERLTSSIRLEYRRDRGVTAGTVRDADTLALKARTLWRIDDDQRLSFNIEAVSTDSDESSILDGELIDASFGYAYRPVAHDRLNVLLKYRFLQDFYGQRVDGTDSPGPRQKSHVFSVDAEYDLNRHWSIGGKAGFRLSETSASETAPFVDNDAWLLVANARYHLVHEWDALIEVRALGQVQSDTTDYGVLAAAYKQFGTHFEAGLGYNFGRFSDDLTDLTQDDEGVFLNLIAKF